MYLFPALTTAVHPDFVYGRCKIRQKRSKLWPFSPSPWLSQSHRNQIGCCYVTDQGDPGELDIDSLRVFLFFLPDILFSENCGRRFVYCVRLLLFVCLFSSLLSCSFSFCISVCFASLFSFRVTHPPDFICIWLWPTINFWLHYQDDDVWPGGFLAFTTGNFNYFLYLTSAHNMTLS